MSLSKVTYIWMDGAPTRKLRCKTRVLSVPLGGLTLKDIPHWNYDGSSTYQAIGSDSDLTLIPVAMIQDPTTTGTGHLVFCEVFNPDGAPHKTNSRARLRAIMENGGYDADCYIGFEQEYTLFKGSQPLGWPQGGYPAPQGPFYCGVGADEVFGRELIAVHLDSCLKAGLMIYGINAEVMPGQWEFQVGYRDIPGEAADPLSISDQLWFARWILYYLGEQFGISVSLEPKPIKGDWNGAGKHTNFSTRAMRDPKTGIKAIHEAIARLEKRHAEHIAVYGLGLEQRLTGHHETAPIHQFSSGVAHRGASIRIPRSVAEKGYGYFEDRRPGANADPYEVSAALMQTVCGITAPTKFSKPNVLASEAL